jgi:hypothetical protein
MSKDRRALSLTGQYWRRTSERVPLSRVYSRGACPGRGAAFFALLRRAGTHTFHRPANMDPGSAAHR